MCWVPPIHEAPRGYPQTTADAAQLAASKKAPRQKQPKDPSCLADPFFFLFFFRLFSGRLGRLESELFGGFFWEFGGWSFLLGKLGQ